MKIYIFSIVLLSLVSGIHKCEIEGKKDKESLLSYSNCNVVDSNNVFDQVDVQPQYPNSIHDFIDLVLSELIIDQYTFLQNDYRILLLISKEGESTLISINGNEFSQMSKDETEIINAYNNVKFKKWKPGYCKNEPVACYFVVPLSIGFE